MGTIKSDKREIWEYVEEGEEKKEVTTLED